jgi:hypothetical protein
MQDARAKANEVTILQKKADPEFEELFGQTYARVKGRSMGSSKEESCAVAESPAGGWYVVWKEKEAEVERVLRREGVFRHESENGKGSDLLLAQIENKERVLEDKVKITCSFGSIVVEIEAKATKEEEKFFQEMCQNGEQLLSTTHYV